MGCYALTRRRCDSLSTAGAARAVRGRCSVRSWAVLIAAWLSAGKSYRAERAITLGLAALCLWKAPRLVGKVWAARTKPHAVLTCGSLQYVK
jgi:hypothetical protein